MKKILNWTFGACFRTLGRFLAIFIVGVLLIFIGSKIGIELPDWLSLRVNAATKENWGLELTPIPRMNVYDAQTMNQITVRSQVIASQTSGSTYEKEWNVWEIGEKTYGANGYMWEFPSQLEHTPNYLYSYQLGMCATKSLSSATIELFAGQYGSKVNTDIYSQVSLNSMNSQVFSDWNANNCYILYGYYVPSNDTAWSHMRIYSPNSVISNLGVYVFSFDIEPVGIWTSGIKDIIDNSGFASADSVEQVQESVDKVEQEIQQTNDTITNDDTSGAQDSADGFFNDFQSEDFGLSSIVTAPLRGINAMLTDTCVAPSATYKGQTFSLPCGSMLWSRPGGEDFKSFINVMYGGFLAYLVISKFFLDVETLKNPNSDKVEVDKL